MVIYLSILTGCGWLGLRDKSGDYLLSEETVKTQIPDDMAISKPLEQLYPIPGISRSNEANLSFEVPRPLPASENTFDQLVKIQSFDENRWILINIPPNETWPRLRNVLNRSGVADSEDAFPLVSTETLDTDGDGIGNNTDTDDDGDGISDADDLFPLISNVQKTGAAGRAGFTVPEQVKVLETK